jgi:hypothetical protein
MNNTEARYVVVHPLDDTPEVKCSPDGLGKMHMSPAVRFSLFTLRGYIVFIVLTAAYRMVTLAMSGAHHLHG